MSLEYSGYTGTYNGKKYKRTADGKIYEVDTSGNETEVTDESLLKELNADKLEFFNNLYYISSSPIGLDETHGINDLLMLSENDRRNIVKHYLQTNGYNTSDEYVNLIINTDAFNNDLTSWYTTQINSNIKQQENPSGNNNAGEPNKSVKLKIPNTKLQRLINQAAGYFGVNINDKLSLSALAEDVALGGTGLLLTTAANVADSISLDLSAFSSQSQAIDGAVHATSLALAKTGNPYLIAASGVLEAGNYVTKAAGLTVQGFDVNINSSGYNGLGHMASAAHRIGASWDRLNRELENRNEQAIMALNAANIAQSQSMHNEATNNGVSIADTIQRNQVALSGGVDVLALAAKKGAKLLKSIYIKDIEGIPHRYSYLLSDLQLNGKQYIQTDDGLQWLLNQQGRLMSFAKNGAKLRTVDVGDPNLLPTGAMHKNKNNLTELKDEITHKGIPVITINDDTASTYEEIIENKDNIELHAEIELHEVIWSKSLTDYLEEAVKLWEDSDKKDNNLLLEVGLRITKEFLFNTKDEDKIIKQTMKDGRK